MGQVDGKVAIVTGGASGIGAACAESLAREGATRHRWRYDRRFGPAEIMTGTARCPMGGSLFVGQVELQGEKSLQKAGDIGAFVPEKRQVGHKRKGQPA
jgi:NAD(P)-dependent dehydrogenase (short-subunit alcohol dehydrogenase family)